MGLLPHSVGEITHVFRGPGSGSIPAQFSSRCDWNHRLGAVHECAVAGYAVECYGSRQSVVESAHM